MNFYFIYFLLHVEELILCFQFFLLIAILIFLSLMTNNQRKCSTIFEKIAMWASDDEGMINYEWSNNGF